VRIDVARRLTDWTAEPACYILSHSDVTFTLNQLYEIGRPV